MLYNIHVNSVSNENQYKAHKLKHFTNKYNMTCYEEEMHVTFLSDQEKNCVIILNTIFTTCNFVLNMFLCICIYLTNQCKNQAAMLSFILSLSFCSFAICHQAALPMIVLMGNGLSCTARGILLFIPRVFFICVFPIITLICVDRYIRIRYIMRYSSILTVKRLRYIISFTILLTIIWTIIHTLWLQKNMMF